MNAEWSLIHNNAKSYMCKIWIVKAIGFITRQGEREHFTLFCNALLGFRLKLWKL